MTFRLGLTGSIGMGKSTTARLFADEGCAVWDADAAVHRLYSRGGAAVEPIKAAFPEAVRGDAVSRDALKEIIGADPAALKRIESIVHPLVGQDREDFIKSAREDILVFDIPLLFETGGDTRMDAVVVVTVDAITQRDRVLARGTMTEKQFDAIREKQMPDTEKRARADYVVITDTMGHARKQVQDVVADIRKHKIDA
jgi:dephospho-CoA kinase